MLDIHFGSTELTASQHSRKNKELGQTANCLYNLTNNNLCQQFSGLYKLVKIRSEFKQGQFKQIIDSMRIQGQDSPATFNSTELLSTTKQTTTNSGK